MPRYEYIYEIVKDADGVDCYVKRGELVRCWYCKWWDIQHPYGTLVPDAYHCKRNDSFYSAEHFCAYGGKNDAEKADKQN